MMMMYSQIASSLNHFIAWPLVFILGTSCSWIYKPTKSSINEWLYRIKIKKFLIQTNLFIEIVDTNPDNGIWIVITQSLGVYLHGFPVRVQGVFNELGAVCQGVASVQQLSVKLKEWIRLSWRTKIAGGYLTKVFQLSWKIPLHDSRSNGTCTDRKCKKTILYDL